MFEPTISVPERKKVELVRRGLPIEKPSRARILELPPNQREQARTLLFDENNENDRVAAAKALAGRRGWEVRDVLFSALSDKSNEVKAAALNGLAKILSNKRLEVSRKRGQEILAVREDLYKVLLPHAATQLFQNDSPEVRKAAVGTLREIGLLLPGSCAGIYLKHSARLDDDPAVRKKAGRASDKVSKVATALAKKTLGNQLISVLEKKRMTA